VLLCGFAVLGVALVCWVALADGCAHASSNAQAAQKHSVRIPAQRFAFNRHPEELPFRVSRQRLSDNKKPNRTRLRSSSLN
jgi:hypothetical protein